MRIVYYAIGGGLGHLVRARAFLHTLDLSNDAVVLTVSDYARDRRVVGDLGILFAPRALDGKPAALRDWLLHELERMQPECLCIDAFPAGILGELCDLRDRGIELWHVARLLRWDEYRAQLSGDCPHFHRVFRVEPLTAAHDAFLRTHADSIEDLELIDPPGEPPIESAEPYWLIVHSGPAAEVAELIAYAEEIRRVENADVPLLVISANTPKELPPGTRVIDVFPATPYFGAAQRIFSAAGFNVMRQTRACRAKHVVLPMPRKLDDQMERARWRTGAAHAGPKG
jgi:hypothetical protein